MTTTAPRPTVVGALRDHVIKLAERVTSPLVPSDYLDVIDPLRSSSDLRGRIVAIHPETRDAVSVVIKPGRGWRTHIPGQYIRIGVDVDGVRQWRAYSLTSTTGRPDGHIAITVKAIPDGVVSNHLVRRATVGTVVQLDQATGDFTLGARPPAKILFVTAGSGITPVMGMLRNLSDRHADVVVVHSAPTAEDVIFGGELRMMASQGRIRLVERHTDVDGMLDVADLDSLVGDVAERQTWACGPAGILDALQARWDADGITDQLHIERFRPAVIAAGDGGTVTFQKSRTVVEAGGTQTLLDAGEAAGVLMPSGCRMGICYGCVVPLRQGAVRDLRTGDLTTAAPGDNVAIQTCVSAAAGACDIDL
ncbi:ferredoxin reductase [Mycolicibacter sinensis]|uniref:Stearoyl-CoA 9-desaturase n=1 Tax=Mycolicibacter sinensis (strain JDM601) TaxID=875328 RepID=A0A1A2E7Y7_MYCSD|nr:ferredoxin reductase [Mycolicibacter sinensis]OBG01237.1 stearoyl-CoA 9-desaturase [Mycolicibacter sinensis]OBG03541.1 stearoyl-CoA 9-desaturase [Mycolicibacter sinensis]